MVSVCTDFCTDVYRYACASSVPGRHGRSVAETPSKSLALLLGAIHTIVQAGCESTQIPQRPFALVTQTNNRFIVCHRGFTHAPNRNQLVGILEVTVGIAISNNGLGTT